MSRVVILNISKERDNKIFQEQFKKIYLDDLYGMTDDLRNIYAKFKDSSLYVECNKAQKRKVYLVFPEFSVEDAKSYMAKIVYKKMETYIVGSNIYYFLYKE